MAKTTPNQTIKSLAARLSDPEAMRQVCEDAGRQLLDVVRNQPFDRMRAVIVALSAGIPFFKGLNRKPARPGDFVCTDHALAQRVLICRAVGERMEKLADRSKTQTERDDVRDMLAQPDMAELYRELVDQLKKASLDETLDQLVPFSDPDSINQVEDDLVDGQAVKLDIMLFILSRAFLAASERLKDFVAYSPPDP